MIMGSKIEVLGKTSVPEPFCPPQISHILALESNPGIGGERPASNRLSHGADLKDKSKLNYI
jgi:hypothetical protein